MPLDPQAAEQFYVRAFVEPSLDVTGILGGKPGLRNTTLVSAASAGVTIRVAPGQGPHRGARRGPRSRSCATPSPTARRWIESDLTPPAVLPRDTAALRLARDAFAGVFGRSRSSSRGRHAPDRRCAGAAGHSDGDGGLALPDSHTHSPNERMLLETFPLGVAAARGTYRALGALSPSGARA